MLNRLFSSFRPLIVVFVFVLFVSNISFAAVKLSPEEKEVFRLSYSLGETSYLMPDLISNEKIMGIAIVHSKLIYLQGQALQQESYVKSLGLSKKVAALSGKFKKEVQQALVKAQYDRKKLLQAQKTYVDYSAQVREETSKLYGQKITWLFDVGFLTGFTNVSMQSEYQNKLVLLQFNYLTEFIPYDLPSSINRALVNIANQKDASLTASEIELLRESAQNLGMFFVNPESYSPPATLKNLVGIWEGRLAVPGGSYHKATLKVYPDLSGELSANNLFEEMPIKEVSLAQSIISFDIKPFGEDRLKIKFSGRLVDDMMAGDAVDISGKTGKWQFLRTSKKEKSSLDNVEVVTDTESLDNMIGVWKGKILEANGAISSSTLYFNLVDDSKLIVDNGSDVKELIVKDVAVNDEAIKFIITPKNSEDLVITFLGKVNSGVIEGNAVASDGSKGYWKLLKVEDAGNKLKIDQQSSIEGSFHYSNLCDPVISDAAFDNVIFVSNEKEVAPRNIEYKGYIVFPDKYKAGLTMFVSGRESKLLLSAADGQSKMLLIPKDIKVTPRDITFTTYLDENNEAEVVFNGKIYGDYISGTAKNASGGELTWELVAVNKAKQLVENSDVSDISNIYGLWSGDANVQSFMRQPVEFYFSNDTNIIKISDSDAMKIRDVSLDENKVSFVLPPNKYSKEFFVFNGSVDKKRLTGVITSTLGAGFDVDLKLEKSLSKNNISGIWIGDLHSGNAVADIIFDFTSSKGKVYVDDSNATSGRVELLVSEFKNSGNKIAFNAKPKNSPLGVKFEGDVVDKNISGFAFNELQAANKLTWSASRSSLAEYLPEKIDEELSKLHPDRSKKESFSFLDNLEDKSDKVQESVKSSSKDKNKVEVAKKPKNDSKIEKESVSISDEHKYKKSDIEKAKKQMKKLEEKPEKLSKKEPKVTKKSYEKESEQESKDTVSTNTVVKEEVKNETSESQAKSQETEDTELEKTSEVVEVKEEPKVNPEDYYGKWVGQLDNPDKGKGEIILDLKDGESFMYVDKFGEKVPFKLFEFNVDEKQISFMIKPSQESEFGIRFNGKLIQGVLSGEAVDPTGSKGKWFARKP